MPQKIHLADEFQPDFGLPFIAVHPKEVLDKMSLEDLQKYVNLRKFCDDNAARNPVGAGWTLPIWKNVMDNYRKYNIHIVLGGNQSGKTVLGARMTLWAAATIPEAETYCWHVTEKRSIDDQQRFIYEALPVSIKSLPTTRGRHLNLQYSQKNGFTDGICILPPHPGYRRGGSIKFFNYAQYTQNDQIIEGVKAHMVWADEKIPLALLETLKYRLFTYHGRLLLTYTVIDGWNDTIEKILSKTRTLEKKWIPRLKMFVPIVQESLSMDSCCIYYAHTDDNPFTDSVEFWKLNATADRSTILARAYGVPTKSVAGVFPMFSNEVNVVEHEKLPFIKNPDYRVTRYMAIDPAGSKSWFMLWVAIDSMNTWWIYREYPENEDWALPGDKPGPAQKGGSKGIRDYVDLIRHAEGEEHIFERFIDPRMGAAEKQSADGATTIISDLDDENMTVIPATGGSTSAGLTEIEDGIQLINNLLIYDENKPRDSTNSPRLFVSDRCQNFIYAMKEFTGKLGPQENTKDAIDCARFLRKSNCVYLEEQKPDKSRTGVY